MCSYEVLVTLSYILNCGINDVMNNNVKILLQINFYIFVLFRPRGSQALRTFGGRDWSGGYESFAVSGSARWTT